jgi:hypothetical protein
MEERQAAILPVSDVVTHGVIPQAIRQKLLLCAGCIAESSKRLSTVETESGWL